MNKQLKVSDKQSSVLGLAALFNGDFSIDWLIELSGLKASQVLISLRNGVETGEIVEKDSGLFGFKDEANRLEMRTIFPEQQRNDLLQQTIHILMKEELGDLNILGTLSKHLIETDNDLDGCLWLIRAGDVYIREMDSPHGIACYTKAIDDLRRMKGPDANRIFIDTAIKFQNQVAARNDSEWATKVLQDALVLAEKSNDKPLQALLRIHLATNLWLRGEAKSSLQHFNKGWKLAQNVDDPRFTRPITTISAFYHNWQGRYRDTVDIYEKSVQDVERFPDGQFPLYARLIVANSYSYIGQVNHALGMLDAIRAHAYDIKYMEIVGYALLYLAHILINAGRLNDVDQIIASLPERSVKQYDPRLQALIAQLKSYFYFHKGQTDNSLHHLKDYLEINKSEAIIRAPTRFVMEICWAMENGNYPSFDELSLVQEVEAGIDSANIFIKGMSLRFKALLDRKKGVPLDSVLKNLQQSESWLKKAGNVLEIAWTRIEIARTYLHQTDEKKAAEKAKKAHWTISHFPDLEFPDDLQFLVTDFSSRDNLLEEILQFGQDVVTIRNAKDLEKHIILTVNRITGAERGGIFLLKSDAPDKEFVLRAAKNLTEEEITKPEFAESLEIIREVASSGKGVIQKMDLQDKDVFNSSYNIRSCICVPMAIKNETVGVMYHDNRYLSSAFKETDLKMFTYFAALAAIAIDNAQAYDEIQFLNRKLTDEKQYYKEQHLDSLHFNDFVGESKAIEGVISKVGSVTDTDTTVLILGETGVGKELVAGLILDNSPRRDKPYIRVNCSAFPETLIASELFGHEKGAFTGADERRVGRFELADGGTIFLDEIGDIPMEVQIRLLRVLQNQEFERVGGSKTLRSDFRLIAATNQDLPKLVKTGKFRNDLFFRLNVFPIFVPPLRKRKDDVTLLAHYFLNNFAKKTGKPFAKIDDSEMAKLIKYDWPGNVRELENVIERGVVLSSDSKFIVPELNPSYQSSTPSDNAVTMEEMEKQHIAWALDQTNWKIRGPGGAAEMLDIHYSTLRSRMKKLGVQKEMAS